MGKNFEYPGLLILFRSYKIGFNKIFNKIAIQGTPQMAVDSEAKAYRESTHIVILCVRCPYTKYNLP